MVLISSINILVSGVFNAAVLFLVSAGLQIVFGVQKIVNLACGSFYAIGAYFGITALAWALRLNLPVALFIPILIASGLLLAIVLGPPVDTEPPVVVFTGRELSAEEDAKLHTMARSIVVKGVESPERLLDETALFLHRVITDLPPEKQRMLERLNSSDEDLVGRTVLLVDDDARNIFALSSVL